MDVAQCDLMFLEMLLRKYFSKHMVTLSVRKGQDSFLSFLPDEKRDCIVTWLERGYTQ